MGAIAANYEGCPQSSPLALTVQRDLYKLALLIRRNEPGLVFDIASPSPQLPGEQHLGDILRNHRDEPVRTLLRCKSHVCQCAAVRDDRHRCNPVRGFEEWAGHSRHIEDLERSRKNGECFRVLRLCRARLNEPPPQPPPGAFVRQEQTHGSGAHNQYVCVS